MSQLPHPLGLNLFIFFNAHFLSVNVFQGEGVFLMNYFCLCTLCTTVFLAGGGHKSGQADCVSHKTWLQKVQGGWDKGGGDLEIKIYKINFIFFVLFHVKDTVYGM